MTMNAERSSTNTPEAHRLRVFLCGDVMIGRGIDQILPHPSDPRLYEDYIHSARDYVRLAERANGTIPAHRETSYIWGAALAEWDRRRPDARIINLETSITRSDDPASKGINYRMSPENATCLQDARIDCCALANNHVLDWGAAGLMETLGVLEQLKIKTAGAGRDLGAARVPAILEIAGKGRLIVFSFASVTSGTPWDWTASDEAVGVNLLPDRPEDALRWIIDWARLDRRPGDVIVVSIHWGPNWGYDIAQWQQALAHGLIDRANISAIHGHSSHHPKAIEIYKNRLVLYGCGDFLNDYEGIRGYEEFRGDLSLMYFADFDPRSGALLELTLVPRQMRRLQLSIPSEDDISWMQRTLARECRRFGTEIKWQPGGTLGVLWHEARA